MPVFNSRQNVEPFYKPKTIRRGHGEPRIYQIGSGARVDVETLHRKRHFRSSRDISRKKTFKHIMKARKVKVPNKIKKKQAAPKRTKTAPASIGRKDWNLFDFKNGYQPHEHQLHEKKRSKSRPISSHYGGNKSYWESKKGHELKKLFRDNVKKPYCFNTFTNKKRQLNSTWPIFPKHNVVNTDIAKHDRRSGSCAWRNKAGSLQTNCKPRSVNTPSIYPKAWDKMTTNAVLHDRPASRGFTPGQPSMTRYYSAPELQCKQKLAVRITNYDYFLKMPVANGTASK